jgi:D-serine deaminase-like pyridoxal phosphate-dependent protein
MEKNLETMAHFFRDKPAGLRPHFKNHRVLELASCQIQHGAIGITCARLWQAEKLVHSGIHNVLLANEIVGDSPLRRFAELSAEARVLIGVDNELVIADLARLARNRKVELNVLVDVDLGLKRCGVSPGEAAVSMAKSVVEQGLNFRGIMGYEGHLQPQLPGREKETSVRQAMELLVGSKNQIEAAGIAVEIVSCGGSGDYAISGAYPGVTENQAGSYLLMDTWYAPYAPDFQLTLSVLATIVSKTPGERIVLDAGVKAISGERGLPTLRNASGLKLKALHAEHAPVEIVGPTLNLEVGDRIEILVHYHDGTINLHDRMYGIRNGEVERVFAIEGND